MGEMPWSSSRAKVPMMANAPKNRFKRIAHSLFISYVWLLFYCSGPAATPKSGSTTTLGSPETEDNTTEAESAQSIEKGDNGGLIGLTRAEVLSHRGHPTRKTPTHWYYTPPLEGCTDMIYSEVITFSGDIVVGYDLEHELTHEHCDIDPGEDGF